MLEQQRPPQVQTLALHMQGLLLLGLSTQRPIWCLGLECSKIFK